LRNANFQSNPQSTSQFRNSAIPQFRNPQFRNSAIPHFRNLPSGVQVIKSGHNEDNDRFHKDEEAEYKLSLISYGIRISDIGSHQQAADYPNQLTLLVPHYLSIPESQCIRFNAYCLLSLPGTFIPIRRFSGPDTCAVSIAASPWTTTRPLPNLSARA
jgi:hypothetical protein